MIHTASGGAMEADIRIIVAAFIGFVVFAAVLAEAAPVPPVKGTAGEPGACPPVEKVAEDRGSGQHNVPCDERWGRRHLDKSLPAGSYNPYRETGWLLEPGDRGGAQPALGLDWRGRWRSGASVLERRPCSGCRLPHWRGHWKPRGFSLWSAVAGSVAGFSGSAWATEEGWTTLPLTKPLEPTSALIGNKRESRQCANGAACRCGGWQDDGTFGCRRIVGAPARERRCTPGTIISYMPALRAAVPSEACRRPVLFDPLSGRQTAPRLPLPSRRPFLSMYTL
jgi:hypothetical protein